MPRQTAPGLEISKVRQALRQWGRVDVMHGKGARAKKLKKTDVYTWVTGSLSRLYAPDRLLIQARYRKQLPIEAAAIELGMSRRSFEEKLHFVEGQLSILLDGLEVG